ncbi:MAG: hypothetical protein AAF501_20575, partial [Pseudomonadota bacterium]
MIGKTTILKAARLALPAVLGIAIGGAAMAQTWTGASDNPSDLRYRLDLLDAELADIRARLGGGSGGSTRPASGSGGGSSIEVGRLEAEVARLTGEVERLQFENRRLQEQVARQLEDLVFRVTELEGGDVSAVPSINLGGGTSGGGTDQPASRPVILSEQADLDRAKLDIQQGRFD